MLSKYECNEEDSDHPIACININKLFVEIFQLLSTYETIDSKKEKKEHESDNSVTTSIVVDNASSLAPNNAENGKFKQLSIIFGTLLFNEKLLFKFCDNWEKNNQNISQMIYFKNTNFEDIYNNKLSKEEQKYIYDRFQNIYELAQTELFNRNIPMTSECSQTDDFLKEIMSNDCIKKLLGTIGTGNGINNINSIKKFLKNNEKKLENITQYMNKIEKNEIKGPEDITNLFNDLLSNNDLFQAIASLFNESSMLSNVSKIFENIQNAYKNECKDDTNNEQNDAQQDLIFKEIIEKIQQRIKKDYPDVATEIEKLMDIFNIDKIMEIFTNSAPSDFDVSELSNMQNILNFLKKYIDNNPSIQNILWKLYMTLQSGLINLEKIKQHCQIILKIALEEFNKSNIISENDVSILSNLLFKGYFGQTRKKQTKMQRKQKRIKTYRRKKRKQYKKEYEQKHTHK